MGKTVATAFLVDILEFIINNLNFSLKILTEILSINNSIVDIESQMPIIMSDPLDTILEFGLDMKSIN